MATKTKAQINSEISSLLADNTTGDISAQDIRTVTADITDSYEDLITAGTTSQYWRGDKTWQDFPTNELTGSLTAAQINALDTAPITLLAAAGANKYYVIENAAFHYKAGGTGFTTVDPLVIYYNTANARICLVVNPTDLSGTTSKINLSIPIGYADTTDNNASFPVAIINDSIVIKADGAISGGNGTINFSIKYRIVTTS
ncbi:MAG: hypothetical protein RIR01_565 [Bacteroidota bacterium]|jgi:hypothetical protein